MTEEVFVERLLALGYKHLPEIRKWESVHRRLRQEHGRERSVQKTDRQLEIGKMLSKNPDLSIEQIDAQLKPFGMALSIIDKIYILKSRKDNNNIKIQLLGVSLKEFHEYGFGVDPRADIARMEVENQEIDHKIAQLKEEYKRIFPKKEIFK